MWQDLEERGEVRSCEGPLVGSARGHLGDDFFAAVLEKWVPLADTAFPRSKELYYI